MEVAVQFEVVLEVADQPEVGPVVAFVLALDFEMVEPEIDLDLELVELDIDLDFDLDLGLDVVLGPGP